MLAFGVWWRGLLILHPRIRLSLSVWDGSGTESNTASGVEPAPVGLKAWRSRDVCCQRGGKNALNWAWLVPSPKPANQIITPPPAGNNTRRNQEPLICSCNGPPATWEHEAREKEIGQQGTLWWRIRQSEDLVKEPQTQTSGREGDQCLNQEVELPLEVKVSLQA